MSVDNSPSELAHLIRSRRIVRGMSQARLGARVDRTATTVRRWERGESLPTDDLLDGLAEALEVPRAEIDAALAATLPEPEPEPHDEPPTAEAEAGDAVVRALPERDAAGVDAEDDDGDAEDEPPAAAAPAAVLPFASRPDAEPDGSDAEPGVAAPDATPVLVSAPEVGVAAADMLDAGAEVDVVVAGAAESVGSEALPWIDVPTETILAPPKPRLDGERPAAEAEAATPEPTQPTVPPMPRRPATQTATAPAPAQLMIIDKSYIEDRWQRLLYSLRLVLTVVALAVMAVILAWAAIELWDAIGAVLDLFGEQVETPDGVIDS